MKKILLKTKIYLLIFLTIFLYPLIKIFILLRKRTLDEKLNIFIIPHLTRVGDLICSTPVFYAIKNIYPNSKISVLVSKKAIGIIKNNPRIDDIIIYEDYSFLSLMSEIRKRKFNWSFSLSGTSISTLLVLWGLIPNRVKLTRSPKPFTELITDWMCNFRPFYIHHTFLPDFNLKILEVIKIFNPDFKKEVFTTKESDDKAGNFYKEKEISNEDLVIGISITAGNKIKEWGDDKFLKLANKINKKYKSKLVFIGSGADKERVNNLLEKANNHNFIGATNFSLEELPSLMKRFNLYISVDTGPVHVADSLNIPLIDIIGPADPNELVPKNKNGLIIAPPKKNKPSVFAFKKTGKAEEQKLALKSIDIDDVFVGVVKLLDR